MKRETLILILVPPLLIPLMLGLVWILETLSIRDYSLSIFLIFIAVEFVSCLVKYLFEA